MSDDQVGREATERARCNRTVEHPPHPANIVGEEDKWLCPGVQAGREATGFGGECVVLLCFLQREPESRYCTHHKDWSGRRTTTSTTEDSGMTVDTTHLHGTTDALVWAETFDKVRAARLAQDGFDIGADADTMTGWFASALMAQYDADRRSHA